MSAAVISPVIPPAKFQAGMRPAAAPAGASLARLPLPLPALISRRTPSAVYGLATLDDRGRLAERTVIHALGWPVRQRLTLRETAGLFLLYAEEDGALEITGQGHLRLPALYATGTACKPATVSSSPQTPGSGGSSSIPRLRSMPSPPHTVKRWAVPPHDHPTCTQPRPTTADLDAARLLLSRLGVSASDLLSPPQDKVPAPTFAEYIPIVSAAVTGGTRRMYGTYWNRILKHWGSRRLDEPTPSEIKQLVETIRTQVVVRRNARGCRSVAEHLIAAMRCIYRHAENDGHINTADNPP